MPYRTTYHPKGTARYGTPSYAPYGKGGVLATRTTWYGQQLIATPQQFGPPYQAPYRGFCSQKSVFVAVPLQNVVTTLTTLCQYSKRYFILLLTLTSFFLPSFSEYPFPTLIFDHLFVLESSD